MGSPFDSGRDGQVPDGNDFSDRDADVPDMSISYPDDSLAEQDYRVISGDTPSDHIGPYGPVGDDPNYPSYEGDPGSTPALHIGSYRQNFWGEELV